MANMLPEFVSDAQAARLLGIPVREFRGLVDRGALPPPSRFHKRIGYDRWDRATLLRIVRGDATASIEDVHL